METTQNTRTATPTLTAPCGCTFTGRMYSTWNCTVLNRDEATGRAKMRHAMNVKKHATLKDGENL